MENITRIADVGQKCHCSFLWGPFQNTNWEHFSLLAWTQPWVFLSLALLTAANTLQSQVDYYLKCFLFPWNRRVFFSDHYRKFRLWKSINKATLFLHSDIVVATFHFCIFIQKSWSKRIHLSVLLYSTIIKLHLTCNFKIACEIFQSYT